MGNIQLSDVEYEDGCYSGVLVILNEDYKECEYFSFVYDIELDSLDLRQREYPDFAAPFISSGYSDYMIENYWVITHEIKSKLKSKYKNMF